MTTGIPPVGGFASITPVIPMSGAAFDGDNHVYIGPYNGTPANSYFFSVDTNTFLQDGTVNLASVSKNNSNGCIYCNGYVYNSPSNYVGSNLLIRVPAWPNFSAAGIQTVDLATVIPDPPGSTQLPGTVTDGTRYLYLGYLNNGTRNTAYVVRVDTNNFTAAGVTLLNLVPAFPAGSAPYLFQPYFVDRQFLYGYCTAPYGNGIWLVKVDLGNFDTAHVMVQPTSLAGNQGFWWSGKSGLFVNPNTNGPQPMQTFDKRGLTPTGLQWNFPNWPSGINGSTAGYWDNRRFAYNRLNINPAQMQVIDEANPSQENYFSLTGINPATGAHAGLMCADHNGFIYTAGNTTGDLIRFQGLTGRFHAGSAGPN